MSWYVAMALVVAQVSPSPSPTPSAPSDPCGSISSLIDRPTVTTSPCTVRPNHVLVETGWTNTVTTGAGGGNVATYPQAFVRVGTFDPHLEFTFAPPSYNRSTAGGLTTGWSDINLGAKYELGYDAKAVWGIGAIVSIPTGNQAFTAGNAQYMGDFNWTYALSPVFSLAGTVSVNALSASNGTSAAQSYFACIPSVVLSASLPQNASLFAEYAYYSQTAPVGGARSAIQLGYSRDFGPNVQADAEYGFLPTLVNGQTQHYAGAGISFMF